MNTLLFLLSHNPPLLPAALVPFLHFSSLPRDFMPHGFCYRWDSALVWLNAISDALIFLAYMTIPFTLLHIVRRRKDLPFNWMLLCFGLFIVACGFTHALEVWNLWHADYWLAGATKSLTAGASVLTAALLVQLVPKALSLPDTAQWAQANRSLENEVQERRRLELELRLIAANYRKTAALLDLTHDAILVRNLKNEIVFWNAAAERLYGWTATETVGKTTHALLETVFPEPLEDIEAEILKTGSWEGQLLHRRRDGATLTVSSRWALQSENGVPIAILESNRDITHVKQEERKFRNLLESAPDAMVIADTAGRIVLLNAETERLFGYRREELLGQPVEILVPERSRGHHPQHRQTYSQHPVTRAMGAGLELWALRKDGSEFPVEISLSPLETREGTSVTAAIRDISQRKRAEAALKLSEQRLSLLFRGVKDYAFLTLDPDGLITTWNEGAQRIKGYSADEIIGKHFSTFYPPDAIAEGKPALELEICKAMGTYEEEGWRVRKDGTYFWASILITALRDDAGHLQGFGKVTRDATERKKSDERLAATLAELQRSNEELQQFAYVASHDLQEPLRMVASYTQLLARRYLGQLDADADEFIGYAVDGCNRMQGLIQDLLSYSRAGIKTTELRETSAEAALQDALKSLQSTIEESGAVITHGPLPTLLADGPQLAQLFQNLIGNAIKYRGTETPQIRVAASRHPAKGWIFSVCDNGIGIDPKYFDRIFVLFQRLHARHEFEGTGIGLSICKKIVERQGGSIWVESQLGKGSTFHFNLPQKKVLE